MAKEKVIKDPRHGTGAGPGNAAMRVTEKPNNMKKAFKDLLGYMGRYKIALFFIVIFAISSTVFQVIGPKVMGNATTEIAKGLMRKIAGTGEIDFPVIGKILLITAALYGISSVFGWIQGWMMAGITQKTVYRMRKEIIEKINRMPMKYFESRPYGEVLSRVTNDVDTLGTGLNQSFTQVLTSTTTIIGVIVMMLTISPIMTLIALCILPIAAILLGMLIKFSQKHFKSQQECLGKINGQIEETFSGQNVVKAFNKEDDFIKDFDETNDILYSSAWKSQCFSGVMMPLMNFVGNLGYAGVAISGGLLAIKGTIGIGDIQAFIQYVKNMTQPISQIAQVMNQIQSMTAASERVFEFLNEEEEVQGEVISLNQEDVKGLVEFDHVRFGYDSNQVVIGDFSAKICPGQKVAIVGPTGAGKTTIVKLLMRYYDVNGGQIKLDGTDVRNLDKHEMRENFGMVLQDIWLYSGTIRENIRFGNTDATDEEVEIAAKAAHAHHFIKTLPGGYDMVINEDATNISQGQKQLITIARAILANTKVMILDEATSSVDTRTEVQIQSAMDNLMEGRTSFIIAHRLSTIRNADLILVMNHGDIVEQGTHDELLAINGVYAGLYNSQFEEEIA